MDKLYPLWSVVIGFPVPVTNYKAVTVIISSEGYIFTIYDVMVISFSINVKAKRCMLPLPLSWWPVSTNLGKIFIFMLKIFLVAYPIDMCMANQTT